MGTERKGRTEILVGLFLFIGLAILGMLVVTFGRLGSGIKNPYELTILFPNATGLTEGADVLLGGAKIGLISSNPKIVGDDYEVAIRVKIQGDIHIPENSKFTIGSAGLLGDKFVDVVASSKAAEGKYLEPGALIKGSQSGGLDELAARGGVVLEQLTDSLKQVQATTANLNKQILSEANLKNIQQTLENLRDATAAFKKTSLSLDGTLGQADTFLGTANSAMKTIESVGKDLRPALADIKLTTERASKAAESVQKLTRTASEGKGPLGVLVNDKETAENLRSLISNLRHSGVLFYKDRPAPPEDKKGH